MGAATCVGILCRPYINKGHNKGLYDAKNPFDGLDLTKLRWSKPVKNHVIKKHQEPETINVVHEVFKSLPVFFG